MSSSESTEMLEMGLAEEEIQRLHDKIQAAMKASVEDAIRIGEILTLKRAQLPKGRWMKWIDSNLPFSSRTARRYVQLYREKDQLVNVSNLTDAYHLVSSAALEAEEELQTALPGTEDAVIEYVPVDTGDENIPQPSVAGGESDALPDARAFSPNSFTLFVWENLKKYFPDEGDQWDALEAIHDWSLRMMQERFDDDTNISEGGAEMDETNEPEDVQEVDAGSPEDGEGREAPTTTLEEAKRRIAEKQKAEKEGGKKPVVTAADIIKERLAKGEPIEPPPPKKTPRDGYFEGGMRRTIIRGEQNG